MEVYFSECRIRFIDKNNGLLNGQNIIFVVQLCFYGNRMFLPMHLGQKEDKQKWYGNKSLQLNLHKL